MVSYWNSTSLIDPIETQHPVLSFRFQVPLVTEFLIVIGSFSAAGFEESLFITFTPWGGAMSWTCPQLTNVQHRRTIQMMLMVNKRVQVWQQCLYQDFHDFFVIWNETNCLTTRHVLVRSTGSGHPSWRRSLRHVVVATLSSFLFGYHLGYVLNHHHSKYYFYVSLNIHHCMFQIDLIN